MKIFIFSSAHQWNDTRVFYKEAVSLAKKYLVELHAPAEFEYKEYLNVRIIGLPLWSKVSDRRNIRKILFKRVYYSDFDVFHFHDPELIFIGLYIKLFKRKKVIFDVHENVGATILTKQWLPKILRRLIFIFYKILEKLSVLIFDKIILAEESYQEFIKSNFQTIFNYPIIQNRKKMSGKFQFDVIYVGSISIERNIFEMLEAASIVKHSYPTFLMKIIGFIEPEIENEVSIVISNNKLSDNVSITGRMDYVEAMNVVLNARIGLALLSPHKNYLCSLSTKLYEYMSFGIPVITNNFPLWREFIQKSNCGLSIDSGNPEEIAQAIIFLLDNSTIAGKMGDNGYNAVKKKFSWSNEEQKLYGIYDIFD